jgi:hypothetical protein
VGFYVGYPTDKKEIYCGGKSEPRENVKTELREILRRLEGEGI